MHQDEPLCPSVSERDLIFYPDDLCPLQWNLCLACFLSSNLSVQSFYMYFGCKVIMFFHSQYMKLFYDYGMSQLLLNMIYLTLSRTGTQSTVKVLKEKKESGGGSDNP